MARPRPECATERTQLKSSESGVLSASSWCESAPDLWLHQQQHRALGRVGKGQDNVDSEGRSLVLPNNLSVPVMHNLATDARDTHIQKPMTGSGFANCRYYSGRL
jgi:hypothetical protein